MLSIWFILAHFLKKWDFPQKQQIISKWNDGSVLYFGNLFKTLSTVNVLDFKWFWHRFANVLSHLKNIFLPPPPMGISGLFRLFMPYFIFVVTHIHLRWLAITCRTWFRPSPKPCRGTWRLLVNARFYDQSCHKSMWANDYIFSGIFKLANTFSDLFRNFFPNTSGCVGGRH